MRKAILLSGAVALVMVLVAGVGVRAAVAASPSNDSEAGAIEVRALPFTHSMDSSAARANGPRFCARAASVFYSFTPDATIRLQVDLIGSQYDTTLGVYVRDAAGKVQPITCNDDRFGYASGVRFSADAGVTYFLMVGQCCSDRGGGGGPLVLTADEVSDVELDHAIEVTGGTANPETGMATVSGTLTCNERSVAYREGTLRQIREGLFVARGYFSLFAVCTPGTPAEWSIEVDTDTGIAFGPGSAVMKSWYEGAFDGWRDGIYTEDVPDATITLE